MYRIDHTFFTPLGGIYCIFTDRHNSVPLRTELQGSFGLHVYAPMAFYIPVQTGIIAYYQAHYQVHIMVFYMPGRQGCCIADQNIFISPFLQDRALGNSVVSYSNQT